MASDYFCSHAHSRQEVCLKRSMLDRQERILMATEIKHFFVHPRCLHFVPLMLAGVMLVLWPYFSSPFAAVFVVLFAGLEPQFANIFFHTPHELESLSFLPMDWHRIVKAKDLSTILVLFIMLPIVCATLLYFSPSPLSLDQAEAAALYLFTILFPLIHIGNMRSVQHPRRKTGWQTDDLAGSVELLISMGILSIPYLVFDEAMEMPALCIVYAVATMVFWWRYSIRKTAELLDSRKIEICLKV